jgi:hypothetical protein
MGNAYTRIKQPELVRRALLDHAAKLAVEQGLAAVTVQAVSDAAGVTKGGFTQLTAIRLAADGLWLADLTGVALGERIELRNHLLQHTYEQGVERPHEAANSRTGRSKKNGKNVRMATS